MTILPTSWMKPLPAVGTVLAAGAPTAALASDPSHALYTAYASGGPLILGVAMTVATVAGLYFTPPAKAFDVIGAQTEKAILERHADAAPYSNFRNMVRHVNKIGAALFATGSAFAMWQASTFSPEWSLLTMGVLTMGTGLVAAIESKLNGIVAAQARTLAQQNDREASVHQQRRCLKEFGDTVPRLDAHWKANKKHIATDLDESLSDLVLLWEDLVEDENRINNCRYADELAARVQNANESLQHFGEILPVVVGKMAKRYSDWYTEGELDSRLVTLTQICERTLPKTTIAEPRKTAAAAPVSTAARALKDTV
jgi:hypothetical protein